MINGRAAARLGVVDDIGMDFNFDVIAYRGATVASRAGWVADAKSRGGVITQVPGGFFHDVEAARFGSAPPYVYELPPLWLLVWDGIDPATDEFLSWMNYQGIIASDANQLQAASDAIDAAKGAVSAIPDVVKYLAIGLVALAAMELLGGRRRA